MQDFINIIRNTDLFKCFSYDELDKLFTKENYKIKKYTKNSVIYFQNEKCESLDVILNGIISIQKIDSEGDILTIYDFMGGNVLGENLLFSHRDAYPMTVITKSDATILHVKKDLILNLCQYNVNFLKGLLQSLSDKTLILSDKIKSLTLKTIRQCIIEFLLFEYYSQKSLNIKLNMTKKELAEKIGVQRSSLSRELNKMRSEDLINYDARYITIKNLDLLKSLKTDL